jgi:hypothetical protein
LALIDVEFYEVCMKSTFYGGKNGHDFVCFDGNMNIAASGSKKNMLELARKNNYAVAKIEAIRYRRGYNA